MCPSGPSPSSGNLRGQPPPQDRRAPSWHYSQGQQVGGSQHSWEPCPAAQTKGSATRAASDAQMDEQVQLLWALSDQAAPRFRKEGAGQPKGSVPTRKRQDREVRFGTKTDRPPAAPASPARAKPGPPQKGEQGSEDEGDCQGGQPDSRFCPPPRPFAHPKKCPVQ